MPVHGIAAEGGRAMALGDAHVVVIDDAEELRTLFAALLADAGCRATVLAAPPAVSELAELAPDALVVDLLLGPDEEAAWGLVATMRADPRLRDIPVLACSAATTLLDRLGDRFAAMGVVAVPKPFELDDFLGALSRALAGRGRPVR
jgi:CheY-like chemotaxis protein